MTVKRDTVMFVLVSCGCHCMQLEVCYLLGWGGGCACRTVPLCKEPHLTPAITRKLAFLDAFSDAYWASLLAKLTALACTAELAVLLSVSH